MVNQVGQWRNLIRISTPAPDLDRLTRVNNYFNQLMRFGEDSEIWGQADYWATPMESLHRAAGDCEDFAIAKYYSLILAGVPMTKLRLVYVKATNGNTPAGGSGEQAHMVMAYYPTPDSEPMILDNLITDIRPASRRPDLQPVFSFNGEGIYAGPGGKDEQSGNARLSRWQDLMQRASQDGF